MPPGESGIRVGDRIKFVMSKGSNGCLFPRYSDDTISEYITVDGEVLSVDHDMVEVTYFCPKCNRTFVTTIIEDNVDV